MGRLETLQAAGRDRLFAETDQITFRGQEVAAVVRVISQRERQYLAKLAPAADSVAIIARDALTEDPRRGESFTTPDGRAHKILKQEPNPVNWTLYCQTYTPAA